METLEFIIFGGESKRFHTVPVIKEQRIDSHSFHVAMLCSLMAGNAVSAPLLMAALTHDLAEHRVGDLPAPVKRALPDYPHASFRDVWGAMEDELLLEHNQHWGVVLDEQEMRWLKLADAMEGALYCIRERMMGNRFIDTCYDNFRRYIGDLLKPDEEQMVKRIVGYIDDSWEQAVNGT